MNYSRVSVACRVFVRWLRLPVGLIVLCTAAGISARAAEAATGTISGSVTSKGTRNALQGALVSIPALNRTGFTDNA